ncbi:MAG: c-type cytochrome biogenesis protein CcmI [Devosia sp.]|nr:c-type cytochrome biogenesis protein CcmI [Devosia sp.]
MLFWSLALVVTLIACAALYYAGAGRRVNASTEAVDTPEISHLKLQLREIDADAASGRLAAAEAVAAKAELARELLRLKQVPAGPTSERLPRQLLVGAAVAATAVLTIGVYAALGRPELPAAPLASRADLPPAEITLESAVAQIELQLEKTPEDLRGWTVIAPAYMQLGRFADAAKALRR